MVVRWKMSATHIILVSLPSLCQKISQLVEIWRSSDENNFDCFFLRHGVTPPLKLHNNGPINVNIKRCRCPCSLWVWNGISVVFNDCFQSVRHRTDKILKCSQRNWFPCFSEMVLQCLQWLRLWVSINGCCHNARNVLNRRQIRWIRRPVLRWNVCLIFASSQAIVAFDVCARVPSCWNIPPRLRENSSQLSQCFLWVMSLCWLV